MPKLQYSKEIILNESPLAEAWLELRWNLEPSSMPGVFIDPGYEFALGLFRSEIKDEFGYQENLPANQVPQDMTQHIVRHRFRTEKDGWPLLQLGPGIASANCLDNYNWKGFNSTCLFLRKSLIKAYKDYDLEIETATLRYRNTFYFDHTKNNLFDYLKENLNTEISLPKLIPGDFGSKTHPTSASINLTFDINSPKSTGTIIIGTGTQNIRGEDGDIIDNSPITLVQFEISAGGDDAPIIKNKKDFDNWLNDAHTIIHEWFFSTIDGPIRESLS